MTFGKKITSVAAGAALAVGLVGMAQGSGHAQLTPSKSDHHSHEVDPDGGADSAYTKKQAQTVRQQGGLPKLYGKVNDDRQLTISKNPVASGRYKIIVRDSTRRHNWHIFGNGVDKETSVKGKGRWSFKVRLRDGSYTVVCDPHARRMRFTLNVR